MMGQQPRVESLFYYFRLEDQRGKKIGKPLILPFRESRLDDDVLAIDVT